MKYFTINELTKSDTAKLKNIDNTPTQDLIENLEDLINNLLDPVREMWRKPIIVNSGYRCPELNKAVGGVSTSHHILGCAADITVGTILDNTRLFNMIKDSDLQWTQLILENCGLWVHVSYVKNNLKRQVLYL